jgi:uncharacterized membrane protein
MMSFMAPRLRKPVIRGLAGTLLAAAFLVRGGHTWWFSILIEVTVLGAAVGVYRQGREDNDEGALAGSRADERQQLLGLRSRALSGRFAGIAAVLGLVITTATRSPWSSWWPFLVMLAVTASGYLFGLSAYGSSDSGAADEQPAGHPASSPGTW